MSCKSLFLKLLWFSFMLSSFFACDGNQIKKVSLKVAINAGPEGEAIKTLAPEYKAAEVTLVELPYSSLREQLISTLDNDQPNFDVIMIDDPWFPQLVSKLALLDNVPDSLLKDIVPASLKLCRNPYGDGELYALPFVGNTQLLFYRSDILTSLGIATVPDQWSKLASLAADITARQKAENITKIYGYAIRGRTGAPIVTDFLPIYWSLGGQLVDDRGRPTREDIDSDVLRSALRIYKQLKESSPPGAANFDWSEMTAAFTNGQAVFQLNWPAAISIIDKAILAQTGVRGWSVTLPPGDKGMPGTSMIGNWLLSIPRSSKNVKTAQEFIIWILEQQGRVASSGNPPTRLSVFTELASKPGSSYFAIIRDALENSTPRVRTERWAQIEDAVSRAVTGFIAGTLLEDDAVELIKSEIGKIIQTS